MGSGSNVVAEVSDAKLSSLKERIAAAKVTRKANKLRRKGMAKKVIRLKLVENKLYKFQKTMLEKFFLEAKWLTNAVIASNDIFNFDLGSTVPVVLYNEKSGKCDIVEARELTLGSQMKQAIVNQVKTDIVNLAKKKAKGMKVGARRFSKEQNCIPLKQYGLTYWQLANKNYFKIQKIGKVRVSGAEQIKDCYELAEAKLIRKPSGYYLHILCYTPKEIDVIGKGAETGIDFGCKMTMTDIQGNETKIYVELPDRLRKVQRARSRKYEANKKRPIKGFKCSKNYIKDSKEIRKLYEKVTNRKQDLVKKTINKYKKYELIGNGGSWDLAAEGVLEVPGAIHKVEQVGNKLIILQDGTNETPLLLEIDGR